MQIKSQIKETTVIMHKRTGGLMTCPSLSTCLRLTSGKNGNDKDRVKSNKWAGSNNEIAHIRVMCPANIMQGVELGIN